MPYVNKEIEKKYHRAYYLTNKKSLLGKERLYRQNNKKLFSDRKKAYYAKNRKKILAAMKLYRIANLQSILIRKRKAHKEMVIRVKVETLTHYAKGKPECACCKESQMLFLSLDHILENGAEERRSLNKKGKRGGYWFYIHLRKLNFPEGYQVLCMNCNMGKHHNKGTCPHKTND